MVVKEDLRQEYFGEEQRREGSIGT